MRHPKFSPEAYLRAVLPRLVHRSVLLDTFTVVSERPMVEGSSTVLLRDGELTVTDPGSRQVGDIVQLAKVLGWVKMIDGGSMVIHPIGPANERPLGFYDEIRLSSGFPANNKSTTTTTIGRLLLNHVILAIPFGDKIPYINGPWKLGKIEEVIAHGILEGTISVPEYKRFMDLLFYLGHFTELAVPTLTKRSLTTDPKVTIRKQQLLKEYGMADDPESITKIENELIALDKAYLKGDPSERFYNGYSSRSWDIHRKKMFLTVGGIEKFMEGSSGELVFMPNSLSEGWDQSKIPDIANEIRKASFDRGRETQKGGTLTKYILRIFQTLAVTADDCGDMRGIPMDFDNVPVTEFMGRAFIVNGRLKILTPDNIASFKTGVQYHIRSPMTCRTPDGLCRVCVGQRFAKLDVGGISTLAIDISSTMMLLSMKNMHGTKVEVQTIDVEDYLWNP